MRNPKAQLITELQAADLLLGCQGTPTDAAIHRTRLHIKKARALLRLLIQSGRAKRYRTVQIALRGANKALRRSRDSRVVRETLATLARRTPYLKPAILALDQSWRRHEDLAHRPLTSGESRQARVEIGRAVQLVREGFAKPCGEEELLSALTRTYRKAHRAYRHATRTQSRQEWHECRKQTKCLYYQLLVTDLWHRRATILREAHLLESTLGKQRDLTLLAREIRLRAAYASAGTAGILLYIGNRRSRLQRRVDHYARRLFRLKPSAFKRQLQPNGKS